MKKKFITIIYFLLLVQYALSCSWYDSEDSYFNLFLQDIIRDKSFVPFLRTTSPFYETKDIQLVDENIGDWQKYFSGELTYEQTYDLVYVVSMKELNNLKFRRKNENKLLKQLGFLFYKKYKEGLDYLIEAKYLAPYMRIVSSEGEEAFYFYNDKQKNAGDLNYKHTVSALKSLYDATKNPNIKLRYAYQLLRFQHYTRNMQKAVSVFKNMVVPLQLHTVPYYFALEQYAGALRALRRYDDANWNFFQVFCHSRSKKKSAFSSMRLTSQSSFQYLLKKAETMHEKTMAYFLLAYQDFNNPLPMMKKIYELAPQSEVLKVLEARLINELERVFLSSDYDNYGLVSATPINSNERLPSLTSPYYDNDKEEIYKTQLKNVVLFTQKVRKQKDDVFWDIAYAYLCFLQKKYDIAQTVLADIHTENMDYIEQIKQMKMLCDVVGKNYIDANFEEYLMTKYPSLWTEKERELPIRGFLRDILENRYFLQGEYAKAFLVNNKLMALRDVPDVELTKALEIFYKKKNKSTLERNFLMKNMNVASPMSFFSLIYGDVAMQKADFPKAKEYYSRVTNGKGFIPEYYVSWGKNYEKADTVTYQKMGKYDGFNRISNYVFGYNKLESFNSPKEKTMQLVPFMNEFPFLKAMMNKQELALVLIKLKAVADGDNAQATKASWLLGNYFYNTTRLGYFRHLFVMDFTNGNSTKFHFNDSKKRVYHYNYKYYWRGSLVSQDNWELAQKYYQRAFAQIKNVEQKAHLLFQMASVEQGKYYQWEAEQPSIPYTEEKWYEKQLQQEKEFGKVKNRDFRNYFKMLKSDYSSTKTVKELSQQCSYFEHFMKN